MTNCIQCILASWSKNTGVCKFFEIFAKIFSQKESIMQVSSTDDLNRE